MTSIASPTVAAPSEKVSIRTRLKGLTDTDERVLWEVGGYLGRLASADLKERCRLGDGHTSIDWAARKQGLTAASTARWAGAITKASNEAYARARRNRGREIADKRRAIKAIERRAAKPTRDLPGCGSEGGYAHRGERHAKLGRRDKLSSRISRLQREKAGGNLPIVRGGKKLLKTRLHLGAAGLSLEEWRRQWEAARLFLEASGEAGKRGGNECIRVEPSGAVSIRLPEPLAHLANAPFKRYVLDARATFSYRDEEWLARASANKAVAYRVWLDSNKGRWYVDASFALEKPPEVPGYEEAIREGAIGVDLNGGHLSAWRLDSSGNPVGKPRDIPLELAGLPASTRDGRLRAAISEVLRYARREGVRAIAVEELGFDDARAEGRETMGGGSRGKGFRRMVSGIPTYRFKTRLVAMAAKMGIAVIAADPAHTSKWGRAYWKKPLRCSTHQSAAVVIGRRGLGYRGRRKVGSSPTPQRSMEAVPNNGAGAGQGAYCLPDSRGGLRAGSALSGGRASREGARPVSVDGEDSGPIRGSRTVRGSPPENGWRI